MEIEIERLDNLSKIPGQEYIIWPMNREVPIAQTDSLDAAIEMARGDLFGIEVLLRIDGSENYFPDWR